MYSGSNSSLRLWQRRKNFTATAEKTIWGNRRELKKGDGHWPSIAPEKNRPASSWGVAHLNLVFSDQKVRPTRADVEKWRWGHKELKKVAAARATYSRSPQPEVTFLNFKAVQ